MMAIMMTWRSKAGRRPEGRKQREREEITIWQSKKQLPTNLSPFIYPTLCTLVMRINRRHDSLISPPGGTLPPPNKQPLWYSHQPLCIINHHFSSPPTYFVYQLHPPPRHPNLNSIRSLTHEIMAPWLLPELT